MDSMFALNAVVSIIYIVPISELVTYTAIHFSALSGTIFENTHLNAECLCLVTSGNSAAIIVG